MKRLPVLPPMTCVPGCTRCCGIVPCTESEYRAISYVRERVPQGPAVEVLHDERGCHPCCAGHALWRRTACSRIGGHGAECKTAPAPVTCSTCNDTHRMQLGEELTVPCTRCPKPCGDCGATNSAYCHRTPCSCRCHRGRDRLYLAIGGGIQVLTRDEARGLLTRIASAMDAEDGGLEAAEREASR